jgi:hypothetical protein
MDADDMMALLLTGAGATALVDVWALVRKRTFGTPLPNYGFLGRWIAGLARGRFTHDSIAAAPSVRAERAIGWTTHYLIGIAFAFLLSAVCGPQWVQHPTLMPALIVGVATVVAPFFVMQPAMGAGIAASRTPRPAAARIQSFVTHAMFGLGLYVAAKIVSYFSTGE